MRVQNKSVITFRSIDILWIQQIIVGTLESLSEQEKKALLASSSGLDRIMLLLLLDLGLEVKELIGTVTSDIDFGNETILVRSSGEKKKISPKVMVELKNYLGTRPGQVYLFEGRCGKPVTGKWKKCVLEKQIKSAVGKSAGNG
jgi:integrase